MDDLHTPLAALRELPQVQRLLELPATQTLLARAPRAAVVAALRGALAQCRAVMMGGGPAPAADSIVALADAALAASEAPGMRRVLNATGIVLHTNLGRAPLAEAAVRAVAAAAGYTNLEFSLEPGMRGPRAPGVEALLCRLTGAEAAVAVNNCAAAMLLALSALAAGGEVLVSRGELIEIGGGFRIPDVIQQGGARLVEVGTTNKTRLADYAAAVTPATRVILKVHPSNYRMVGFTAEAGLAELAGLARAHGLLLVHDLGSGAIHPVAGEPTPADSVAAGADVVAFSGDKLLGGPQSGLLVGRAAAIAPLRKHPLLRALRLDKLTLAALEATLRLHQDPVRAVADIPALRMLAQDAAVLQARAERLAAMTGGEVVPSVAFAGGGTLPADELPSRAVALDAPSADELARRLRLHDPAVVGRIAGGRVLLDVFTLGDTDLPEIASAVRAARA